MSHPDRQPASNGGRSRVALLIHAARGAVPLLKAVRACFAPGLIIAVVRGEDSFVAGFGETAPGNKAEPDGQSIFRLGSVSKVFATDVLAKLVAQGHVGLTDPLSRYAPDGVVVKSFGSTPFTLLEPLTPQDCRASCAIPQSRMATAIPFCVQHGLLLVVDFRTSSGVCARHHGGTGQGGRQAVSRPLQEQVMAPLALTDTTIRLSDKQKTRLMVGLDPFNQPDPNWEVPGCAGCAGI